MPLVVMCKVQVLSMEGALFMIEFIRPIINMHSLFYSAQERLYHSNAFLILFSPGKALCDLINILFGRGKLFVGSSPDLGFQV